MHRFWQVSCFLILKLLLIQPILAQSTLNESNPIEIAELTLEEQTDLKQGEVILQGEKGQYVGQVITQGNREKAWEVLTDYDNFANFLPNIASSKIIQANEKVKIFEQINIVDLLILEKQFTVKIEATETYPQLVNFKLVEGDLGRLEGTWEINKLPNDQVLIVHRVNVAPQSEKGDAFFFGIYESSLEETIRAIAKEISDRSTQTATNQNR